MCAKPRAACAPRGHCRIYSARNLRFATQDQGSSKETRRLPAPAVAAALCPRHAACFPTTTTHDPTELILAVLFFLVFLALVLVPPCFWIWMLIDCLTKEPSEGNDKIVWALVIFALNALGALLYFFVRRPKRKAQYGR